METDSSRHQCRHVGSLKNNIYCTACFSPGYSHIINANVVISDISWTQKNLEMGGLVQSRRHFVCLLVILKYVDLTPRQVAKSMCLSITNVLLQNRTWLKNNNFYNHSGHIARLLELPCCSKDRCTQGRLGHCDLHRLQHLLHRLHRAFVLLGPTTSQLQVREQRWVAETE